jgi:3',5'-cyclic AMP phosphodiesterase CpdA
VSGGTVQALSAGKTTITAKVGGIKLKCKVTVVVRDWTKDKNGDGLPDYWDSHAQDKVTAIRSHALAIGTNGLQFQFVTDFHSPSNRLLSVPLFNYVARHTGIRMIVNGGDLLDTNHSKAEALGYLNNWNSYVNGLTVFNVRGNHDSNAYPEGRLPDNFITDQEYYSMMIAGRGHTAESGKLYYYRDDPMSKTRIIVLDTGSPAEPQYKYVMKEEQKVWLKNLLLRQRMRQHKPIIARKGY